MGAKVTFKIITSEKLPSLSVVDGQLIFVEDEQKIYLDYHGSRKCYTPEGGSSTGDLKFRGVMDDGFNPKDESTWKIDGVRIYLDINDVVAYGKKEYMYRKAKDAQGHVVEGLFELGDEDAPEWDDDD